MERNIETGISLEPECWVIRDAWNDLLGPFNSQEEAETYFRTWQWEPRSVVTKVKKPTTLQINPPFYPKEQ